MFISTLFDNDYFIAFFDNDYFIALFDDFFDFFFISILSHEIKLQIIFSQQQVKIFFKFFAISNNR